jgi:hypothetical protein
MLEGLTWQAAAAWLGAALGIVNLIRSAWVNRPVFHLDAVRLSGTTRFSLEIINMSNRPLLVRRIRIIPKTIWPFDESENTFDLPSRSQRFNMIDHRWVKVLGVKESKSLPLIGLKREGWFVLLITWSQSSFWPWSIVWATPGEIKDLNDSVNPLIRQ